jgi:hypothetical protein
LAFCSFSFSRKQFEFTGSDKVIARPACSDVRMPANHKVSVAWQIVALFIPIANFWAFYRIRRLLRYLVYVILPSIAVSAVSGAYYYYTLGYGESGLAFGRLDYSPYDFVVFDPTLYVVTSVISWGLFGFSIYLVIIWSKEHNQKYKARTNAT